MSRPAQMRLVWSVSMTMCGRGMATGTHAARDETGSNVSVAQVSRKFATKRGRFTPIRCKCSQARAFDCTMRET